VPLPVTADIYKTESPNFLSEGHISYYTNVRGPDILHNRIVSGYVILYQIRNFFAN